MTPSAIPESSPRRNFIDGLRGIAILLVLVNHFYGFVIMRDAERWAFLSRDWLIAGRMGVVLFFLVSAYTLFSSSRVRFSSEKFPYRNFYLRRAFRILPLWWVSLVVFTRLRGVSIWEHLDCLFLYYPFTDPQPLNYPGWSLFVEETFYIFLPLIFPLIRSGRRALTATAIAFAIRLIWLYAGAPAWPIARGVAPVLFPTVHWYAFGLGILLYFLSTRFAELARDRRVTLVTAAAAAAVLGYFLPRSDWGHYDEAVAAGLALFFLLSSVPGSGLGRIVGSWPLRRFGLCCYSLYLFHLAGIRFWNTHVQGHLNAWLNSSSWPVELKMLVYFSLFSSILLALGSLSWYLFERPLIRMGKWVIDRGERKAAAEVLPRANAA